VNGIERIWELTVHGRLSEMSFFLWGLFVMLPPERREIWVFKDRIEDCASKSKFRVLRKGMELTLQRCVRVALALERSVSVYKYSNVQAALSNL